MSILNPHGTLLVRDVTVERGDQRVLSNVDLTLTAASRLAVVGPNGVGKSTLFATLAGALEPTLGSVKRAPENMTVGLVRQELDRTSGFTARESIAERSGLAQVVRTFEAATEALARGDAGADDTYSAAFDAWMAAGAAEFDARLGAVADTVGLPERVLDLDVATLSGGQAARVGLAVVMVSQFDITLLDEPTNDLDLAGLDLLERWVGDHRGGLAIISHDRAFLERTISSVAEIDEHAHTVAVFNGGWQSFLDERDRARSIDEDRYATFDDQRDRLKARAQQQQEWATQGVRKAKQNPSDGDKHVQNFKLNQTEKLVAKASATKRAMERLETVDKPWEGWDLRFTIEEAPRSAKVVAAFDDAVLTRGDWSIGPINLEIRWADRLALVGPNGSGKSTLINALLEQRAISSGAVSLGSGVVVGELDQGRGRFHRDGAPLIAVFQELTLLDRAEARSVLAKFGLGADAVERGAASLSPGERTRAQLALFQATGVNLLVLDEPTNHLDLPAIEQLESALETFGGTVLLVSHDRRFLEHVAVTRTVDMSDFGSG